MMLNTLAHQKQVQAHAPVPVPPAVDGQLEASVVPAPAGQLLTGFRREHPQLLVQVLQLIAVQPALEHTVADEQLVVSPAFAGLHQVFALQFAPLIAPKAQNLPLGQVFGN
jgi:hypothetical protein